MVDIFGVAVLWLRKVSIEGSVVELKDVVPYEVSKRKEPSDSEPHAKRAKVEEGEKGEEAGSGDDGAAAARESRLVTLVDALAQAGGWASDDGKKEEVKGKLINVISTKAKGNGEGVVLPPLQDKVRRKVIHTFSLPPSPVVCVMTMVASYDGGG